MNKPMLEYLSKVQEFNGQLSKNNPMRSVAKTYSLNHPECKEKPKEEFTNTSGKSIDFSQNLKWLKKSTEIEFPYTLTQSEDIMFLDQTTAIATEFHYFNNDCIYTNFISYKENLINGELINEDGEKADHLLGT